MVLFIDSMPFVLFGVMWWFILGIRGIAEYYATLIAAALVFLVVRQALLPVRRFLAFHCCRLLISTGLKSFVEVGVWKGIVLADPFRSDADYGDRFYEYLADVYPGMREALKNQYLDILARIEKTSQPHVALLARDIHARIDGCAMEGAASAVLTAQESRPALAA